MTTTELRTYWTQIADLTNRMSEIITRTTGPNFPISQEDIVTELAMVHADNKFGGSINEAITHLGERPEIEYEEIVAAMEMDLPITVGILISAFPASRNTIRRLMGDLKDELWEFGENHSWVFDRLLKALYRSEET